MINTRQALRLLMTALLTVITHASHSGATDSMASTPEHRPRPSLAALTKSHGSRNLIVQTNSSNAPLTDNKSQRPAALKYTFITSALLRAGVAITAIVKAVEAHKNMQKCLDSTGNVASDKDSLYAFRLNQKRNAIMVAVTSGLNALIRGFLHGTIGSEPILPMITDVVGSICSVSLLLSKGGLKADPNTQPTGLSSSDDINIAILSQNQDFALATCLESVLLIFSTAWGLS